jgi:hypothetical protein
MCWNVAFGLQEEPMTHFRSTRLLMAGAALILCASPALALDGPDLVKKLLAASNLRPGNLQMGDVEVNGATVTLKAVTLGDDKGGRRTAIGDIVLEGVAEAGNGGYTIEKARFADVNVTEGKTTITARDLYLSGVVVPATVDAGTIDSVLFYDEAHSGPVDVTVEGKPVAAIRETSIAMEREDDNSGISFTGSVDGIFADLGTIDDPKSKAAIDSLGLAKINGTMTMEGSWEAGPGTLDVTEYAIDLDSVGRLDLAFSISGYTLAFIKSVQETTAAMEANPNKEAAQQAAGLAALGLMQQISFNSAEISFEDDGVTNRALDYSGRSQGVSGEQMAMMIKGMAPLFLAQLNVPSLQNSLSAAINSFLDDPKNFTITAAPTNPVPLPMIIGAAQAAPNSLPDMLGVSVSAND